MPKLIVRKKTTDEIMATTRLGVHTDHARMMTKRIVVDFETDRVGRISPSARHELIMAVAGRIVDAMADEVGRMPPFRSAHARARELADVYRAFFPEHLGMAASETSHTNDNER